MTFYAKDKLSKVNLSTLHTKTKHEAELTAEQLVSEHNFKGLLSYYGCDYQNRDGYLHVGQPKGTQGWLLHISVVRFQLAQALQAVIPILLQYEVPFKVAQDIETARMIMDGNFGDTQVGKALTIFPPHEITRKIADELIDKTMKFYGPDVLTDVRIMNVVWTRYGSFNPIYFSDEHGNRIRYIYEQSGQLVKDLYQIPYRIQNEQNWPFSVPPTLSLGVPRVYKHRYKIVSSLKSDPKGVVLKAIYIAKWLKVKQCVIKQGKRHMWSDEEKRDMTDRLAWQYQIHKELKGKVPIPNILDHFILNGDAYIVMDCIEGTSVKEASASLTEAMVPWFAKPVQEQKRMLLWLLQILNILEQFHKMEIVHRDITPVNFLVDQKDKLWIIDNEMSYSLKTKYPQPPFVFGTRGFTSPQQMRLDVPTTHEDIYGFGATMIHVLTGLYPTLFNPNDKRRFTEALQLLTNNIELTDIMGACLEEHVDKRPTLEEAKRIIVKNLDNVKYSTSKRTNSNHQDSISDSLLRRTIQQGIVGLASEPTLIRENIWQTAIPRPELGTSSLGISYGTHSGLAHGVSGVLFFLAIAKSAGFAVGSCEHMINSSFEFLNKGVYQHIDKIAPGLYGGAAGISLALAKSVETGLVQKENYFEEIITKGISLPPFGGGFTTGLAGQGMALLKCAHYLDNHTFLRLKSMLSEKAKELISTCSVSKKVKKAKFKINDDVDYNIAIDLLMFLQKTYSMAPDEETKELVQSELNRIWMRDAQMFEKMRKDECKHFTTNDLLFPGFKKRILLWIEAFENFQDPKFKDHATRWLEKIPNQIVIPQFDQETGLAGLGELYLRAYRIFQEHLWLKRADWIANVLIKCAQKSATDSVYWIANNRAFPTAELISGNSGILKFLLKRVLTY